LTTFEIRRKLGMKPEDKVETDISFPTPNLREGRPESRKQRARSRALFCGATRDKPQKKSKADGRNGRERRTAAQPEE